MKSSNNDAPKDTVISLDDIPEVHRGETVEWVKKKHVEFVALAKATGWPIEKIYDIYNLFGIHLGMGLDDDEKKE